MQCRLTKGLSSEMDDLDPRFKIKLSKYKLFIKSRRFPYYKFANIGARIEKLGVQLHSKMGDLVLLFKVTAV